MKINNIIGASLLLAISLNASAASTADLGVTGLITPAACEPTLSGNGFFDYGDISADLFNGVERVSLSFKQQNFNILCKAPTLLGLSGVGENNDSISNKHGTEYNTFIGRIMGTKAFLGGLGFTADGKRIGAFAPVFDPLNTTDLGNPLATIASDNNGPWAATGYAQLSTGGSRILSFATPGNLVPTAVTDLNTRFGFNAVINASGDDSDGLTFEDVIDFEGRIAIEVVYL